MATPLFGYPIVSDPNAIYAPTFDGGAWSVSLPLANLQDRRNANVARSTSAAITATQFTAHLGRQARVGVVALVKHTISQAGTVRVRGFTTAPAFRSLTVGDASWTSVATPTRSAAAFTSSDGVPLDLIGDDNGAAQEYYTKVVPLAANGQKVVAFRIKKGTIVAPGGSALLFVDSTAAAELLHVEWTWTGSVPTVTPTTGTVVSVTALPGGSGDYRVVCLSSAATAAHAHIVGAYAAVIGTDQGNLHIGDVVIFDAATDDLQFDGGVRPAWPVVYPAGSLPAGDPRIGGTYTAEEALDVTPDVIVIPPAIVTAMHWLVEIADPTNPAGYIDIGRLVIAGAIQPSIYPAVGAKIGFSTESVRTLTDGGAAVYTDRPRRREFAFTISNTPQDEALVGFWEMQRRLGIAGQLFFVFDAADTHHLTRRAMLCTMKELTPLEYPWGTALSVPFALTEEL